MMILSYVSMLILYLAYHSYRDLTLVLFRVISLVQVFCILCFIMSFRTLFLPVQLIYIVLLVLPHASLLSVIDCVT